MLNKHWFVIPLDYHVITADMPKAVKNRETTSASGKSTLLSPDPKSDENEAG